MQTYMQRIKSNSCRTDNQSTGPKTSLKDVLTDSQALLNPPELDLGGALKPVSWRQLLPDQPETKHVPELKLHFQQTYIQNENRNTN